MVAVEGCILARELDIPLQMSQQPWGFRTHLVEPKPGSNGMHGQYDMGRGTQRLHRLWRPKVSRSSE